MRDESSGRIKEPLYWLSTRLPLVLLPVTALISARKMYIRCTAASKPCAHRNVLKATEPDLGHSALSLVPSQPFPGISFPSLCFLRTEVVTSLLGYVFSREDRRHGKLYP